MKYQQEIRHNIISLETAKLLKRINCPLKSSYFYGKDTELYDGFYINNEERCVDDTFAAPMLHEVQGWIREDRGVNICVYNNASGYIWSMDMTEGGTDLGWSDFNVHPSIRPLKDFNRCLDHAIQCNLVFPLPENCKEIKHWSNYSNEAILKLNIIKDEIVKNNITN